MQNSSVDEMDGVEVTGGDVDSPPLMTEQEKRILEMYDRLEELQLEIALLQARGVLSQDEPVEVTDDDIKVAEHELLKAKAHYQVRTNIVENVLMANPILKAVHAGTNASIIEQDLLPLTQQRDSLSMTLAGLSSQVLAAENELMAVESEHAATAQENVEFANTMLALADAARAQRKGDVSSDPKLRAKVDELRTAMRSSRQRWRILKSTASATIAGSGLDWARDPRLLEIVMDDDDDDDDDDV